MLNNRKMVKLIREYVQLLLSEADGSTLGGGIIDPIADSGFAWQDTDVLDTKHDLFGRWYRSPGQPPTMGNNFFVDDPKAFLGMTPPKGPEEEQETEKVDNEVTPTATEPK